MRGADGQAGPGFHRRQQAGRRRHRCGADRGARAQRRLHAALRRHRAFGEPVAVRRQAALRHAARAAAGVLVDAGAQHAELQRQVRGQDGARADCARQEQAGRARLCVDRCRHGAARDARALEPTRRHQDQSRPLQGDGRRPQRSVRRPRADAVRQCTGHRGAALGQGGDLHGPYRAEAGRGSARRAGDGGDIAGLRDLGVERRVCPGRHRPGADRAG